MYYYYSHVGRRKKDPKQNFDAGEEPGQTEKSYPASVKAGVIDETERQFSPEEKRIAERLSSEGKDVKALAEGTDPGRSADALVDGAKVEFKSLGLGATNSTVKNRIVESIRGGGQARNMILDARGSGLSEREAARGLNRASNLAIHRGMLDSVRILGDGFDVTRAF